MAAYAAVRAALSGRGVLYTAPTADQTDAFWAAVSWYVAPLVGGPAARRNETRREVTLTAGGNIRARTAWNADTLRSGHADFLIMDEYALMDESAWKQVGAPMLLDNNGDAWFIFTPKRKNHAYRLYLRALANDSGRWAVWNASSRQNPHLSRAAIAELSDDMTAADIRQEIDAEFLESDGAVFHGIADTLWPGGDTPDLHAGHRIVAGADWGRANDYTACSVLCATCAREVALVRMRGHEYVVQLARIATVTEAWGVSLLLGESNSIGDAVLSIARRGSRDDGVPPLPVKPFATTAQSKRSIIEGLALAIERQTVRWLNDIVATSELESYELTAGRAGHVSYSAPAGAHDDTVIARALALRAAGHGLGDSGMDTGRMFG